MLEIKSCKNTHAGSTGSNTLGQDESKGGMKQKTGSHREPGLTCPGWPAADL